MTTVSHLLMELHQLHEELNESLQYATSEDCIRINSSTEAADLLIPFIGSLDHEEFWVINLNTNNAVMSLTKLYQGTVDTAMVRVAEVFRQAIMLNATQIIVAHNHPSGNTSPSTEDVTLTRSIIQAGKLLDIKVLDHLVIGANTAQSMQLLALVQF